MKWFTSDTHLGDTRLNLYGRDISFKDNDDFENTFFLNWLKKISHKDTVYIIGDVAFTADSCLKLKQLPGKKILITGNYDRDDMTAKPGVTKYLPTIFSEIYDELLLTLEDDFHKEEVYLNHFPTKCRKDKFNLTGHIHGSWRIQRNMINVGLDAWNYQLISEENILFFINAIRKFYDKNVFAGELPCNLEKT